MTTPGAAPPGPDPLPRRARESADGRSGSSGDGQPSPTAEPTGDWTDQVTELIVETVDKVRVRTTGPVLNVTHASVYGIVAAIVAIPVLVALLAGLVRFLDWLVPGEVWAAYLIIAVVMWIPGAILWSKRERADAPTH
jgi:hypothetical protein